VLNTFFSVYSVSRRSEKDTYWNAVKPLPSLHICTLSFPHFLLSFLYWRIVCVDFTETYGASMCQVVVLIVTVNVTDTSKFVCHLPRYLLSTL